MVQVKMDSDTPRAMASEASFSLADFTNAFRRRLPLFLYLAVPIVLIAAAFAIGLPDIYRSEVRMEINLQDPQIGSVEPIELTTFADQYASKLERNVLTRTNMLAWIRELDVYSEMTAEGATDSDLVGEIAENIRITIVTTDVLDSRSGRDLELIEGFTVGFDHSNPKMAQRVADRMAAAFLDADRAIGAGKIDPILAFLKTQMSNKRSEIEELESQIADFKEGNAGRMPDTTNLNISLLDRTERELDNVRQEIRDLEQNQIFRKAQLGEIENTSAASSELARLGQEYVELLARVGPEHPDLIRIKRQIDALTSSGTGSSASAAITSLEAELAVLLESYTEEHPDVARKRREIQTLRQDQASTINSLRGGSEGDPRYLGLKAQVNAIDNQLRSLRSRESEVRRKIAELEIKIAATPQVEREFIAMERDLDSARETFRELQRDYEEKMLVARLPDKLGARLRQVSAAWAPDKPASPPRLTIVILGVFLAFSIGGMAALVGETMDSTVRGSRDIYELLHTQPIGVIPVVQNSVSRAAGRRKMLLMMGSLVMLVALILTYSGFLRWSNLF